MLGLAEFDQPGRAILRARMEHFWSRANANELNGVRRLARPSLSSLPFERGAGERRYVRIRVRVSGDSPAAFGRLGEEHAGAFAQAWLAGGGGDDLGELLDDAELLLAVEDSSRCEHLHSHVGAVAGDVGDRGCVQVVDERGGVVREER